MAAPIGLVKMLLDCPFNPTPNPIAPLDGPGIPSAAASVALGVAEPNMPKVIGMVATPIPIPMPIPIPFELELEVEDPDAAVACALASEHVKIAARHTTAHTQRSCKPFMGLVSPRNTCGDLTCQPGTI